MKVIIQTAIAALWMSEASGHRMAVSGIYDKYMARLQEEEDDQQQVMEYIETQ